MKVTKTLLKQYIKEEINKVLSEEKQTVHAPTLGAKDENIPEIVRQIQKKLGDTPGLGQMLHQINSVEELTPLMIMILREIDPAFAQDEATLHTSLSTAANQVAPKN